MIPAALSMTGVAFWVFGQLTLAFCRGFNVFGNLLCHTTAPKADRAVPNSESVVKSVESVKRSVQLAKGGNIGHKGWPPHEECTTPQHHGSTSSVESCSTGQPLMQKGRHSDHE